MASAIRRARRSSVPPAEPPPHDTARGDARKAASRSCSVRCGESAGTTMTSCSPVSRAIGVTSASDTIDEVATIPLTITSPVTSSASSRPRSALAKRARPIVPAAPGTFSTCTFTGGVSEANARCSARAV